MTTSTEIVVHKTQEERHSNFLYKQAEVLANTDIVPSHLKGKPSQIFAIVTIGDTLGIAPATAIQSFASINGQVTMSAELMRALILGQGHSITFPTSTRDTCVIKGRRKETGDECVVEYTLEDAQIAGLCGIKDGKAYARSNQGKPLSWEKYPRQLLAARATTELARLLFPDIIKGVSYTPEEIGGEYIEDDNKISFDVEHAHVNGEPIQQYELTDVLGIDPVGQLNEIIDNTFAPVDEPPMPDDEIAFEHAVSKDDGVETFLSNAQRGKIFAMTGKLVKGGTYTQETLDEAYKVMFGDKSRSDLTITQASKWIEYLLKLEEGAKQ